MTDAERLQLLVAAKEAAQQWFQTPGALSINQEYAQVDLDMFPRYCPDRKQWVLVKREYTPQVSSYELRCVIDDRTGFYIVALVLDSQIGLVRDAFGPNYAEIAIPRSLIGSKGKDMLYRD